MTWPTAVFYSIFLICMTLIVIRAIGAIEKIPKRKKVKPHDFEMEIGD